MQQVFPRALPRTKIKSAEKQLRAQNSLLKNSNFDVQPLRGI
jgi:hypothetical protein